MCVHPIRVFTQSVYHGCCTLCSQAPFHNYVEGPCDLGDGNHCCGQGGTLQEFLS